MIRPFFILAWLLGPALFAAPSAGDEEHLHEQEADLHVPVKWETLQIAEAASRFGKLEPQPDGSLKAPAQLSPQETYTIKASTVLRGITAFRLEVLPEGGSIGRAGNGVLTEFQVTVVSGRKYTPVIAIATADYAQKRFGPMSALDGNPKTGWAFLGSTDKPHAAVFELAKPLDSNGETVLTFVLRQEFAGRNLNRVRISATTKAPPVRELPESIREVIALEPSERSLPQRAELLKFLRSIAPPVQGKGPRSNSRR